MRSRLGVAGHLSTPPRWGNPAMCLSFPNGTASKLADNINMVIKTVKDLGVFVSYNFKSVNDFSIFIELPPCLVCMCYQILQVFSKNVWTL